MRAASVALSATADYPQMIQAWASSGPLYEDRTSVAARLLAVHRDSSEFLTLRNFPELVNLPALPASVRELCIQNCPALSSLHGVQTDGAAMSGASMHWPARLKRLVIDNCAALTALDTNGAACLKSLEIFGCATLESLHVGSSERLSLVQIDDCPKLSTLTGDWSAALLELKLERCASLSNLPTGLPDNLKRLCINSCVGFTHLRGPLPAGLQSLQIMACPSLIELCDFSLTQLRSLMIWACPQMLVLPSLSTPRLLMVSIVACEAFNRLPATLPESMTHLELSEVGSLTFVPQYHPGLEVILPLHLRPEQHEEGARVLPAAYFEHIVARSGYANTEIRELIDHFSLRTANRCGKWLDTYTPLAGGDPISIATQNLPFELDVVERIDLHHPELAQVVQGRVPDLSVNLQRQVIVAEQSAEGQAAIASLYSDIASGDVLSFNELDDFTCMKKPSPLMQSMPIAVEDENCCRRLSATISALAQQIPKVSMREDAAAMVSLKRAESEIILYDGGYAVHSSRTDRALLSQVLSACKQGDEAAFLAAMADFQAGWPTPGPLDGARLTFQEEFVQLFVTGYFSSEWIKREYYHFILRCGQIH